MNDRKRKITPVSARSAKIVEDLAHNKFVETLVLNVTHKTRIVDEIADLTQIIYLALLEMDSSKLQTLVETNELKFFVVRMIANQYYSVSSPFYYEIRKFKMNSRVLSSQISESHEDKDGRLSFLTK